MSCKMLTDQAVSVDKAEEVRKAQREREREGHTHTHRETASQRGKERKRKRKRLKVRRNPPTPESDPNTPDESGVPAGPVDELCKLFDQDPCVDQAVPSFLRPSQSSFLVG